MAQILIVEDDQTLSKAYSMILEKEGHTVKQSFNGKQALEALKEFDPNIILLDLMMPEMGGLDFLRHYKADSQKAKVLVFTNMENPAEADEAHRLGAYRYIVKSWASPSNLIRIVADALEDHGKNKAPLEDEA
jgi:DNA-binding NtrC family response regulator